MQNDTNHTWNICPILTIIFGKHFHNKALTGILNFYEIKQ